MLKDLPIKPQPVKKSGCNKVMLTGLVMTFIFLSLVALFANARQDMVWAFFHKTDVELVKIAREEVNKGADSQLKEAVSRVFITKE